MRNFFLLFGTIPGNTPFEQTELLKTNHGADTRFG